MTVGTTSTLRAQVSRTSSKPPPAGSLAAVRLKSNLQIKEGVGR